MAVKGLVEAIIQFLSQQIEDGDITEDSRESLDVAIQCLESAYNIQLSETTARWDLLEVFKNADVNGSLKAEAERLKNEGNALMKAEKYQDALVNYSKAIQLNGRNAIYYCNRAAAYSKLGNHRQAIEDCHIALSIDPTYSKAYGRLGLAYSSLDKHEEAKQIYQKALEMEPNNESYRNNLQITEEKLAQAGNTGPSDNIRKLARLMYQRSRDPNLMNTVQETLRREEGLGTDTEEGRDFWDYYVKGVWELSSMDQRVFREWFMDLIRAFIQEDQNHQQNQQQNQPQNPQQSQSQSQQQNQPENQNPPQNQN